MQLELLLRQDEKKWTIASVDAKKKAKGINEQMQNFLQEQNRKLAELIGSNTFELEPVLEPKFTLRKLLLWGKTGGKTINFEWPSKALLDTMPADVRLQSLDFKGANDGDEDDSDVAIASVKVTLTNDFSSKVFEKQGVVYVDQKTLVFDAKKQIKRVQGADSNGRWGEVKAVKFMDKGGNELGIYDPDEEIDYAGKAQLLADNEDLIGVYGVMG